MDGFTAFSNVPSFSLRPERWHVANARRRPTFARLLGWFELGLD